MLQCDLLLWLSFQPVVTLCYKALFDVMNFGFVIARIVLLASWLLGLFSELKQQQHRNI